MSSLAELWDQAGLAAQRRTLVIAADALMLCALGNGASDEQIKRATLALRSPEIGILTDAEAAVVIEHLQVRGA